MKKGAMMGIKNHAQAQLELQETNEKRQLKHVAVARALRDPALAPMVVKSAMVQVRLWQEKQLCSQDYIDAWLALLNDPVKAAAILEEHSPYAVQMRQNAPFVSYIRQA
ncbi:MAG: hypothetical protein ACYC3O_07220 [Burkholderiales bacterium]